MYYYIYDSFLADRKYERALAAVETRLTDLGISGRIGRLTPFTSAKGLIRDESRRGVSTIVVVGNDDTVAKVVDGIGDVEITLGIIPIGSSTEIARSLGIPDEVDACDVLSKRLIRKIDLGSVNGRLFLSQVRLPKGQLTMEGDGKYRISALTTECETVVSNLRRERLLTEDERKCLGPGDPQDGLLDALITVKPGRLSQMFRKNSACTSSVIPIKKLSIMGDEPITVSVDGRNLTNSNISIEVVPKKLKIIAGRQRVFA